MTVQKKRVEHTAHDAYCSVPIPADHRSELEVLGEYPPVADWRCLARSARFSAIPLRLDDGAKKSVEHMLNVVCPSKPTTELNCKYPPVAAREGHCLAQTSDEFAIRALGQALKASRPST